MIGKKIRITSYSYFKRTVGKRDLPFVFFYIFPMFTYSKTEKSSFSIHLGWLYFSLLIQIKDDNR